MWLLEKLLTYVARICGSHLFLLDSAVLQNIVSPWLIQIVKDMFIWRTELWGLEIAACQRMVHQNLEILIWLIEKHLQILIGMTGKKKSLIRYNQRECSVMDLEQRENDEFINNYHTEKNYLHPNNIQWLKFFALCWFDPNFLVWHSKFSLIRALA